MRILGKRTHFRRLSLAWLGALAAALLPAACGSDSKSKVALQELTAGCTLNSDCRSPLACAFERCHEKCVDSRDCKLGARCVVAPEAPLRVCQLPDENKCEFNSQCARPLVCASDNQCRNACQTARDCASEQLCISGSCADPGELQAGALPKGPEGATCSYNSDCSSPLVCLGGICRQQCRVDRDCTAGFLCNANKSCEPERYLFQKPRPGLVPLPPLAPNCEPITAGVAKDIVVGGGHTCVLLETGQVRCWGDGGFGVLGYGNENSVGDDEPAGCGGDLKLPAPALQLAAGTLHTCARLEGGNVLCWGANHSGQLGTGDINHIGDNEALDQGRSIVFTGPSEQIVAAGTHSCVRRATQVQCWGVNRGSNEQRLQYGPLPQAIPFGIPVVSLSAGPTHNCAIVMGDALRCWGENVSGQLGLLSTTTAVDPSAVGNVDLGGASVAQTVEGEAHTCVLLKGNALDGQVYCWGSNQFGQLGYNPDPANGVPALGQSTDFPLLSAGPVLVGAPVKQLAAGRYHTCALLTDGKVHCWGLNDRGYLGYGTPNVTSNAPPAAGDVPLGAKALRIAAGNIHTCALLETGDVRCWGVNVNGSLGYGLTDVQNPSIGDDEAPMSLKNTVRYR